MNVPSLSSVGPYIFLSILLSKTSGSSVLLYLKMILKTRSATLVHTSELFLRHATKTKSGMEAQLLSFVTAALNGGK